MLFSALFGVWLATLFTQLMLVRHGYPSSFWIEMNPLFDVAFRRGLAWVQPLANIGISMLLYGLFKISQSNRVKLAIISRTLLYGLGFGYLVNGLNDLLAYVAYMSLPFYAGQLAVVFGGIIGGVVNLRMVLKNRLATAGVKYL